MAYGISRPVPREMDGKGKSERTSVLLWARLVPAHFSVRRSTARVSGASSTDYRSTPSATNLRHETRHRNPLAPPLITRVWQQDPASDPPTRRKFGADGDFHGGTPRLAWSFRPVGRVSIKPSTIPSSAVLRTVFGCAEFTFPAPTTTSVACSLKSSFRGPAGVS